MRPNRLPIIFSVFLAALIFGLLRQRSLQQLRQANATLANQIAESQVQLDELRASQEPLQRELAEQRASRESVAADSAALARMLAPGDTDARWSYPPPRLPEWDSESPYVWLDKSLLTRFPVQPFSSEGMLNPAIASVLTLRPEQTRELNTTLSRLVADYRALEAAHAQRTDQDIPGMQPLNGDRLTIEVPPLPEPGAALKAQFEHTLVSQLGQPRADLIMQTANQWFREQLNDFGSDSRIFSVTRQPDNTYQVFIKSVVSQMSVGGGDSFEQYIPAHLRQHFAELNPPPISQSRPSP